MKFISYSQNFEDVILWRALRHIKKGFYIDVGAAWPDKDSVTKAFYDAGWNGINIEPNPSLYEQYKIKRERDLNLPYAISDYSGKEIMSFIADTGLSTLSQDVVAMHEMHGYESYEKEVDVKTLNQIYSECVEKDQDVHFLKIDVEGLEFNVLNGCNWKEYRPWIIVVESTIPMTQDENYDNWEHLLIDSGYLFCYKDGLNRFYVSSEHSELLSFFSNPPNVFDSFILLSEYERKIELNEAKRKIKKHLAIERSIREQLLAKEHEAWYARHQLQTIYESRYWRFTSPLRISLVYARKLYKFIKYFNKNESPKALVRLVITKLEHRPSLNKKTKKLLKIFGLQNLAAKAVYKSINPDVSYQLDSLSEAAKMKYKRIKALNEINKD